MYLVKTVLSSPESACFLNEIYDEKYYPLKDDVTEDALGVVLKRSEESINDFNTLGFHIDNFTRFDIKRFFNLTLMEWLDTTTYLKEILIDKAKANMLELEKEMENIKKANDAQMQQTTRSYENLEGIFNDS